MEKDIQTFIEKKKIAIVGASRQGNKFGNTAVQELLDRGYEIFLVHPDTEEINGIPAYPNLDAVKDLAQSVWVSVPPERGEMVLHDAAAAGFKNVWLQQGAESQRIIELGTELGLELVTGKCILMYAEPVRSYHKFHQVVWKLFGKY